jgi:hypothetical protein
VLLDVDVVVVDGVLRRERGLDFADLRVRLTAALVVEGAADGPHEAEPEPRVDHRIEVDFVRGVDAVLGNGERLVEAAECLDDVEVARREGSRGRGTTGA